MVGLEEAKRDDVNFAMLEKRKRHIHSVALNVNIYLELECVIEFRLKKQDLGVT